ncbi:MAG: AmmeMemoRadiSam system protein A [Polyangiaceae bacterium]|nr:AmmeMemoRadiSam system protein A [Myxococcales bacterium]MCB9590281.1 AmmeMemoRadiSam system protein A [Polyangiaceae bacterium]MCB9605064.1 AmmeMemoRadiSam system protein A [Polyangiaceae bacterium]
MRGAQLTEIARQAIGAWLDGREPTPVAPLQFEAAVFVTLRDARGELRGCIGSLSPLTPDVTAETQRSAVLAASRDPRFPPLTRSEFLQLSIEVSVLGPPEAILSAAELDPHRYGVVVRGASGRRGVLLPEVPGVEDVATQVKIARQKAGVDPDEPIEVQRFGVEKYLS